jgi:hypothetical protein
VLAAGIKMDMAAVKVHVRAHYTQHKDAILRRFNWLKDPANDVTGALDSGDIDVSDATSSGMDLNVLQLPC